jgi:glutamate/tyrosine decarboxylase-like PLP-dependent enzyme
MQADYLFHGAGGSSPDLGDLSLQCGRRVDAFKLWLSWIALGNQGYAARVDRLFGLAGTFRQMVLGREGFELVREPEGTNVCFRYWPESDRTLGGEERRRRLDETTKAIREQLLKSGRFMINYAPLDGAAALRIVLNNPLTTDSDLTDLLDTIEQFGSAEGVSGR